MHVTFVECLGEEPNTLVTNETSTTEQFYGGYPIYEIDPPIQLPPDIAPDHIIGQQLMPFLLPDEDHGFEQVQRRRGPAPQNEVQTRYDLRNRTVGAALMTRQLMVAKTKPNEKIPRHRHAKPVNQSIYGTDYSILQ